MHFDQTVSDDFIRIPQAEFRNSTWLPAALLATLVLLVSALQAFGGEPSHLEWRPAFAPAKKQVAVARPPVRRRAAIRQQARRDFAVVQVAFEDGDGWNTSPAEPQGAARMDSLVVHPRDPQFEGTGPVHRVAQGLDPFENDDLDAELNRDIQLPFGGEERPGELPDLGAGELPDPIDSELPDDVAEDMTDDDFSDDVPSIDDDFGFDAEEDTLSQPGGRGFRDPGRNVPLSGLGPTIPEAPTPTSGPTNPEAFERERRKATDTCEAEMQRLRNDRISTIDLNIRVAGTEGWNYPFECTIDDGTPYAGRHWPEVTYMWKAAANCHKPLYFEQHHLERYGHSWGPCVQPLISGAHFFTRLPVLPYCMGLTPPNECIYPLGYYRPGNCAPYMIDPVPFSWRAALFQAGATVGTAAVLP